MNKTYMVWQDAMGLTRLTSFYSLSGEIELAAALANMSRAVIASYVTSEVTQVEPIATSGVYQSVNQNLRLLFEDDAAGRVSVVIPSPKESCFQADGITADLEALEDLINECIGFLLTESGYPVVRCVGGYLQTRRVPS